MHIFESKSTNINLQSYAPNAFFKVQEAQYAHSIIVTPQTCNLWAVDSIEELTIDHIIALVALKPTIVLIGTGPHQQFIAPQILSPLMKAHIGFEVMSTPAACRTFTLLAMDDRDVLAALCLS